MTPDLSIKKYFLKWVTDEKGTKCFISRKVGAVEMYFEKWFLNDCPYVLIEEI